MNIIYSFENVYYIMYNTHTYLHIHYTYAKQVTPCICKYKQVGVHHTPITISRAAQ